MKIRLIRDILIYMIIPILFFYMGDTSNLSLIAQIICTMLAIYTIYVKYIESRVNITALMFACIFVIYMLVTKNVKSSDIYFYNTCVLLYIGLIIPLFRLFNSDIGVRVLKDMLRSLNKNSSAIMRLLKKKSIITEIKKISSIIESSIILIVLLRMINIIIFNAAQESYLNFMAKLISAVAFGVVIYKIIKIKNMSKDLTDIDGNENGNKKGKVINFNNFK